MMQVTLDETTLSAAVQTAVSAAVAQGLSSWDLRSAVSAAAEQSINKAEIPQLVERALDKAFDQEVEALVQQAVQEAMPAMRLAASMAIKMLAARMIYGLRNGPASYDSREQEIFAECVAALNTGEP
jgi:phage baseplate assembly protein W